MGKIDATQETVLAQRFGVKGYPSIKVFNYGAGKTDKSAQDYPGGRDVASLTSYAIELLDKADIVPEIHELISQKVYDNICQGQTICIITFLPNIYDSNAAERNGYLETLQKVSKKNRRHPF